MCSNNNRIKGEDNAAVRSKAVVLSLWKYCLMYFLLFVGGGRVLCWYALLCVLSSFAIILKRKRELVVLLYLSFKCRVTVNVLWLFLDHDAVGLAAVCDCGIS